MTSLYWHFNVINILHFNPSYYIIIIIIIIIIIT
jgi:hypothetical protein